MDAPHQRDGALLRGVVSKGSKRAAWGVRRSDQERGNYRMVRLLRWTDLTADCASPRGRKPLAYLAGREPAMRLSTSLLELCCQAGLEGTLATPSSARTRPMASGSR